MARTEVGSIRQPTLRPVASPVDSFANPRAGSGLAELATALQDLSPALKQYADQRIDKEKERGHTDATSIYEDIKSTGQKIKTGEIAAHESKWYRAAAREQVGRLMASAYGQELQLATQTDEVLKESTDPLDFDKFEAETREAWMKERLDGGDVAFMSGFNAVSAQGIMNARQSFIAGAADRLDGQVLENTYTEHQMAIREGLSKGAAIEDIAKGLSARNAAFYLANPKLGPDKAGKSLNRTTIEAVFDAARAFESPELLKILDHIPGGVPGSTLGQTRTALSKRDEVEREIRMNRQNRLAAEEKDDKRERTKVVGDIYDKAFAALEKDPEVDVSQFATALMSVDHAEIPKLFRVAKAFATAANVDDRGVRNGLYTQAFSGELSRDEVADAFSEGTITIPTAKALMAQIRSNQAGRSAKAAVQDPLFTQAEQDLANLWIRQYGDAPGPRGVFARQEMSIEWVKYLQSPEGTAASEIEKIEWLNAAVVRNFMLKAEPGSAGLAEVENAPKPPLKGVGRAELPDWKTELAFPEGPGYGIASFAAEVERLKAGDIEKLSLQAEAIISTHGLTSRDLDEFIRSQRLLKSLRKR